MLLPIELFHVTVSGSTSTSRTSDGTGRSGRAGTCRTRESFRVGFPRRARAAPRVRRRRAQARGVWLWVLGLRVSRALRPTSLAAGGYIG